MLVVGFPAGTFRTNCYVLAPRPGAGCVIVDPGQDVAEPLERALTDHALTPAAVLATHGHPDHVAGIADLARAHDVPVRIRPEDRPMLDSVPESVVELGDEPVEAAGLTIDVLHTPGHTPGSAVFRLETEEGGRIALTGDTLFAGSAGRTDGPTGDADALRSSLALLARVLDDDTVLLPGHGPSTTMERERTANPFLAAAEHDTLGTATATAEMGTTDVETRERDMR
ncbi:hypothetical protein BJF85_22765 [Saccharomonospora sp. CUA-673]|uniref:MBL fold metallo-hydrolase n=1 Tax=Saccharomonospora sp. CUA-673 TaxID=1904969 RepID=UPI000969C369|nr:MBL fold metallo-hydrolase [Saccharomonospora sp. CUA-673]OLT42456.1 hypothetical protein BJF85_22765 [Saccharomonospora sp. CUA-673]